MRKVILFLILVLSATEVSAQLSTNPWVNGNSEETVAKIYQKQRRRGIQSREQNYSVDDMVTIDRSHAYIQLDNEEGKDESLMDKVKNVFNGGDKEEAVRLIPNTKDNRKAVAKLRTDRQAAAEVSHSESSKVFSLPNFGIGNKVQKLKNNFRLPSFNTTAAIKKFEKASGVNFKAIAKQFK